jgi:hypothetical protein
MKSPRFAPRYLLLIVPELIIFSKDPSLCQFCVAGAFRRNEGQFNLIIFVLFPGIHLFDQMVQAQQARDLQILDLVRTMESAYSFVVSADELKDHPVLQDIVEQILKQTIECGYFIQGYTRRRFGGTWEVYWSTMAA